jgi:hypothetical protein
MADRTGSLSCLGYRNSIAEKFHPDKIILFGSYAYGTPHEDSDVDLLVEFDPAKKAMRVRLPLWEPEAMPPMRMLVELTALGVVYEQAKPEVAVNQPEQANGQAKVRLEQNGQPAVQYQSDEPKVVINKPKEEPKIRFEQMAASDEALEYARRLRRTRTRASTTRCAGR